MRPTSVSSKAVLILFFLIFGFSSCDDGEITIEDFNFDGIALKTCGNYVFYKTNNSSFESISLRLSIDSNLYSEPQTRQYAINGTTIQVNYRRFDGAVPENYFCNPIPPSEPNIVEEYIAKSGIAEVTVEFRNVENAVHKDVSILFRDLSLQKDRETIIYETLNLGKIESVQIVEN